METCSAWVDCFAGGVGGGDTLLCATDLCNFLCLCNWIYKTIKIYFSGMCCTSFILRVFLCRRHAYFQPTKYDMVNDHVAHQPLLTRFPEVFRT